jgi:hypothetical protein
MVLLGLGREDCNVLQGCSLESGKAQEDGEGFLNKKWSQYHLSFSLLNRRRELPISGDAQISGMKETLLLCSPLPSCFKTSLKPSTQQGQGDFLATVD